MFYYELYERPLDPLRRWWRGSRVVLANISQCPKCRGTDKAHEVYEGYGTTLYRCQRCVEDWWS